MKKPYSEHHILPRSRDATSKKTVNLPKLFHVSFHFVFGNLYGEELVVFIKTLNNLLEIRETITANDLEFIRNKIKSLNLYEFDS